jgi:hypothetical protein
MYVWKMIINSLVYNCDAMQNFVYTLEISILLVELILKIWFLLG